MSTQRPDRDRITPTLVAVAVVLAVAVGIIVYLAETKDDAPDGHVAGGPVTISTSPSTVASPAGRRYRCWDGRKAASLTDCTDPADASAIGWIFPQEATARRHGSCHSKSGDARAIFVQCDLSWHGHVVYLHLSAWSSWRRARAHYDGGGAVRTSTPRADGTTLLRWQPRRAEVPFPDAPWKVAEMLRGRPWTLAAYADDRATVQQALAAFGRIRDVREWRGVEL